MKLFEKGKGMLNLDDDIERFEDETDKEDRNN